MNQKMLLMVMLFSLLLLSSCQTNDRVFNPTEQLNKNHGVAVFNILDFGARGDGEKLNTAAIQAAIDACAAQQGGTVLVPAGKFVTGALMLKSNVTLYLAPAAVILGSTNADDYFIDGKKSGMLISAEDAENITIEGKGIINGQGWAFSHGSDILPSDPQYKHEKIKEEKPRWRPHMMQFKNCRNITLRDVTLKHSAHHCTHLVNCSYVNINGVRIHNRANHNNDGFDISNCEYVTISNCNLSCGDDAIAFFQGNRNITITNCNISSRWAGIRFGPGATGLFENITISNCVIYDTYGSGIKMQMAGGGRMENISFSDIIMNNVTGPISLCLTTFRGYKNLVEKEYPVGVMRNIQFSRIRAEVAEKPNPSKSETPIFEGEQKSCITVTSVNDYFIENVTFSDIEITFPGGGTAEEASRRQIPELRGIYPEYFMFGVLPSYGMYVRNVRGLSLDNVRFDYKGTELRAAIVCQGVDGLDITGFKGKGDEGGEALIRLEQTKNVFIHNSRPLNKISTFVKVEGDKSSDINLAGNDLGQAEKMVVSGSDVNPDTVTVR